MPVSASVAVLNAGKDFDAVFISRAFIVCGESDDAFCNIRATVPETTVVAMLVPLSRRYPPLEALDVVYCPEVTTFAGYCERNVEPGASNDTTRLPGATTSGFTVRSM